MALPFDPSADTCDLGPATDIAAPAESSGRLAPQFEKEDAEVEGCQDCAGDDEDKRSHASRNSTLCPESLPIVWPARYKIPECKLCAVLANQPSPLVQCPKHPLSGGLWPWAGYKKVKDEFGEVVGRAPKGLMCAISSFLFKALGYDVKFGTKEDFIKGVAARKKDHVEALEALLNFHKSWIKSQRADPDNISLRHWKATADAAPQKELLVKQNRTSGFIKPERVFVYEDCWNEKEDGKFDPEKVVEEVVFGEKKRGIWVLKGKKGHIRFEERDDQVMEDITREEKGSGDIVEHAVNTKRQALVNAMSAAASSRDAVTVDAPLRSIEDLLAETGVFFSGDKTEKKEVTAGDECTTVVYEGCSGDEDEETGGEEEKESDGEQDAPAAKRRFSAYFAQLGGKPTTSEQEVAKAKAAAAKAASAKATASGKATSKQKSVGQSSSPAQPPVAATPGKARRSGSSPGSVPPSPGFPKSEQTSLVLDGRVQRMQNSVLAATKTAAASLDGIQFDEELEGLALAGGALLEFQNSAKQKCRALAKVRGEIKTVQVRVSNSKSGNALDSAVRGLDEQADRADKLLEFCTLAHGTASDLDSFQRSLRGVMALGYAPSLPYVLCAVDASVRKHVLFGDFQKAFGLFCASADEAKLLLDRCEPDRAQSYATHQVETIVSDRLQKSAKQPAKESKRSGEVLDALLACGAGGAFLAFSVFPAARIIRPLILCFDAPVMDLQKSLAYVEKYFSKALEEQNESPWFAFFESTTCLYSYAAQASRDRSGEIELEGRVMGVLAAYNSLPSAHKKDFLEACGVFQGAEEAAAELKKLRKPDRPLSGEQKKRLEDAREEAKTCHVAAVAQHYQLLVKKTVALAEEALARNGFATTGEVTSAITEGTRFLLMICI